MQANIKISIIDFRPFDKGSSFNNPKYKKNTNKEPDRKLKSNHCHIRSISEHFSQVILYLFQM